MHPANYTSVIAVRHKKPEAELGRVASNALLEINKHEIIALRLYHELLQQVQGKLRAAGGVRLNHDRTGGDARRRNGEEAAQARQYLTPLRGLSVTKSEISGTKLAVFFIALVLHAAILGWVSLSAPRANPARPAEPMSVSLLASAPTTSRATLPVVSQPAVKKSASQERVVAADEPSPHEVTAASATESAPAVLPQTEALTPVRFDAAYLRNPAPGYPLLSRRLGEQGRVLLRVMVHADGSAMSVEIEAGSGYPRLDQAARETVRQWRFIPARQGDNAVNSGVIIPIDFSLKG